MALSLIIREIKLNRYITIKYVNLDIYILEYYNIDNRSIKALLKYMTFIVNNLKIKIFIDIDILAYKDINLVIFTRIDYIDNFYISFNFNIILFIKPFIK